MVKKLDALYMKATLMLTMCLMAIGMILPLSALASTSDAADNIFKGEGGIGTALSTNVSEGTIEWPWTRFLRSLAHEVTGPLPMVVGILAVCGAGFALLFGNGGAGTQKALTLICVIGVIMFTPTLVQYIYASATGATVDMVVSGISATASVAPPPLP